MARSFLSRVLSTGNRSGSAGEGPGTAASLTLGGYGMNFLRPDLKIRCLSERSPAKSYLRWFGRNRRGKWQRSLAYRTSQSASCVRVSRFQNHLVDTGRRSEEHTSELQSLMRTSYAVICLKQKNE